MNGRESIKTVDVEGEKGVRYLSAGNGKRKGKENAESEVESRKGWEKALLTAGSTDTAKGEGQKRERESRQGGKDGATAWTGNERAQPRTGDNSFVNRTRQLNPPLHTCTIS